MRILQYVTSSLSASLLALLPKCPACLVMLLAALGIRLQGSLAFLIFGLAIALMVPVFLASARTCRKCGYRPLAFTLSGSALMAFGRLTPYGAIVIPFGAALVLYGITRSRSLPVYD